jgi:hypothetical protein
MLKTVLKYGLIAAALMIAVIILSFWWQGVDRVIERMDMRAVVGYATMVVALGLIFFALREDRSRVGELPFARGLGLGLAITGVASGLFGLATVALYAAIGPGETDRFLRAYVEHGAAQSGDAEAVIAAVADYEAGLHLWLNPWFHGLVMFITVALLGVVISLLASWLLRTRRREVAL